MKSWMNRGTGSLLLLLLLGVIITVMGKDCIRSKVGARCGKDADCFTYKEYHLYCNRTRGVDVCAYQIDSYASRVVENKACLGPPYSAEPWSDPVPEGILHNGTGVDCMRLCLHTPTCFGVVVHQHRCYLRNNECFNNLKRVEGAILAVMSVVREDYHCGCHYPFKRKPKGGEKLLWWPSDCPESYDDRNPYRCCSPKGLCLACQKNEEEEGQGGERGTTRSHRRKHLVRLNKERRDRRRRNDKWYKYKEENY